MEESDPLAQGQIDAAALRPEMDRCFGNERSVLILPNTLPLYDPAQIENPTSDYLFHYDFDQTATRSRHVPQR